MPDDGGPSWLTFLGHAKDSLWSMDLFRCESIYLKSHWVLVIMDQFTRRIIGFGVHEGDVDRYHRWQANLRILGVEEMKTIPYTPLSHPFIERLIGTIRREYLDRIFFWNAQDLERKLGTFLHYYNHSRVHQSLDGNVPDEITGGHQPLSAKLSNYSWI